MLDAGNMDESVRPKRGTAQVRKRKRLCAASSAGGPSVPFVPKTFALRAASSQFTEI